MPRKRNCRLPSVEDFLRRLDELSGTGNGIGRVTVNKLRRIAIKEGFLEG